MANKRKSGEEPSGRDRKKLKIQTARTIPVQPFPAASTSTAVGANAEPSKSKLHLPSSLDVEKFVEARAFEIDAMHTAIKIASSSSTQRAWQALPRHLRRRAASHDVRRVPLRLRDKARAEMDPVRKKAQGKSVSKRGKSKRQSRTETFLARQRDKTWLETHIWHAKRMKMENLWGYRLAVHPTEKSFRPSHRASKHGSIIHDASYFNLIELSGPQDALSHVLTLCCDPQAPRPGAQRYATGSRVLDTHIYAYKLYPSGLTCPATVIWKPPEARSQTDVSKEQRNGEARTKGKAPENNRSLNPDPNSSRIVWILVHPCVFDTVFNILQFCASLALANTEKSGGLDVEIEIADMRNTVNIFEIMGPKSNQVLKGALSPVSSEKEGDFSAFWSSLGDLQSSGSVPRGMVVGCKVNDPRLKFPPKNAKPSPVDVAQQSPVLNVFPSAALARSEIWDETIRASLKKPRYKKKDLDQRKFKHLVPGTPLTPLRQDDRVPILLIQRSLELNNSSHQSSDSAEGIHGWMLIVPAGWSMAFFSSLTYTGTRVGGQHERQTQSFEAGVPYFPRDYPSVAACEEEISKRADEEKARWERTPAAKKPNYENLGTRSPWKPDWELVLGLQSGRSESDFVTTQRETQGSAGNESDLSRQFQPWLLRGPLLDQLQQSSSCVAAGILTKLNTMRAKRLESPLDLKHADLWFRAALVTVQLKMCTRGVLEDMAIIYMMEDDEVCNWRTLNQTRPDAELLEPASTKTSQDAIIGYVTTGNFSLSCGEGSSLGAIAATKYLALQSQMQRLYQNSRRQNQLPKLLVKARNRDGQSFWTAYLQVVGF